MIRTIRSRSEQPYADPYAAGVGLGLVLLTSYALAGRGLGASGAFGAVAARAVNASRAIDPYFVRDLAGDAWLLVEIAGVIVGGFLSAFFAGRLRREVERGPRISSKTRVAYAFGGGTVMGVGAALARGCTSGLALSGGALLSVGSWLFIVAAFAMGYLAAPLLRRAWR